MLMASGLCGVLFSINRRRRKTGMACSRKPAVLLETDIQAFVCSIIYSHKREEKMKQISQVCLSVFLLLCMFATNTSMADIKDVNTSVFCPNSSGVGASLDVEVKLTAGRTGIDLTGKRVMVALSSNPKSALTSIRTYGPFARTIPDDVTITSGGINLGPGESVSMQVNVIPQVPRGSGGTVSHVIAFLIDEMGKVGDNGSCVVPIQ